MIIFPVFLEYAKLFVYICTVEQSMPCSCLKTGMYVRSNC